MLWGALVGVFWRWHRARWRVARNPQATLTSRIIASSPTSNTPPHHRLNQTSRTQDQEHVCGCFLDTHLPYCQYHFSLEELHTIQTSLSLRFSSLHLKSRVNYPNLGSLASSSACLWRRHWVLHAKWWNTRWSNWMKEEKGGSRVSVDISGPEQFVFLQSHLARKRPAIRWARR